MLRFNTRGTSSQQGTSEGAFGAGEDERHDVAAAIAYAAGAGLPARWLVGWSFGTELALRWGLDGPDGGIEGAILISPPLRRAGDADLDRWAAAGKPLTALVPELDDYLRPDDASFAARALLLEGTLLCEQARPREAARPLALSWPLATIPQQQDPGLAGQVKTAYLADPAGFLETWPKETGAEPPDWLIRQEGGDGDETMSG